MHLNFMSVPPHMRHAPGWAQNYGRIVDFYPYAEAALKRSKLKSGENVIIYTDVKKSRVLVDSFFTAAVALGGEVVLAMTRTRSAGLKGTRMMPPPRILVDTMKRADFVVDLASIEWHHTPEFSEILKAGARIITCSQEEDSAIKLFPNDDIRARGLKIGQLIEEAKSFKITSKAGTSLQGSCAGRKPATLGFAMADVPGKWDGVAYAATNVAPVEDSVDGKLVLEPGDMVMELSRIVTDPVTLTFVHGKVVEIEGGIDATLMRNWLEGFKNENSYRIAHVTVGLHPDAEVESMNVGEWESKEGHVTIAIGANIIPALGGTNEAPSHLDMVTTHSSFYASNQQIVIDGKLIVT